jgi:hypothetical protein
MSRLQILAEFWYFMKYHKKYWLAPIIIILVLVGFLLMLAKGSALAPFVYSMF